MSNNKRQLLSPSFTVSHRHNKVPTSSIQLTWRSPLSDITNAGEITSQNHSTRHHHIIDSNKLTPGKHIITNGAFNGASIKRTRVLSVDNLRVNSHEQRNRSAGNITDPNIGQANNSQPFTTPTRTNTIERGSTTHEKVTKRKRNSSLVEKNKLQICSSSSPNINTSRLRKHPIRHRITELPSTNSIAALLEEAVTENETSNNVEQEAVISDDDGVIPI